MARPLARCGHCGVHIYADESKCPFCARATTRRAATGRLARKAFAAAAGVTAFVSGIGCAYGCPDGGCFDFDAGAAGDATTDAIDERALRPDVSVQDAGAEDVKTSGDAAGDAGAADALLDAPSDG
jgi:hypothetical protein